MDKNDSWKILEELSDPLISLERKAALESRLKENPVMWKRLATFRVLQEWPGLDAADRPFVNSREVINRIRGKDGRDAVDLEIKKAFPWVAAAALAAAVVLAFINIDTMSDSADSTLDALFGLSMPTIEDSFFVDL